MPLPPYQRPKISLDQAAGDPVVAPALLAELGPEQWALWRRHPISALLLQHYLPDFRAALEQQAVNGWLSGNLSLNAEQEARGYLLAAHLIESLSLDQVRAFYGLGDRADEVAAKARP